MLKPKTNTDELRTSDVDLIRETMPMAVDEEIRGLLVDDVELSAAHHEHLKRGEIINALRNDIESKHLDSTQVQQEVDDLNQLIASRQSKLITRIFGFVRTHQLKNGVKLKSAEHGGLRAEIQSMTTQLDDLREQHDFFKNELINMTNGFMGSESVISAAEDSAVLAKKAELDDIRRARDVSELCKRENCLVFHTLMEKGYVPGTDFKLAPTHNSPLNYEVASIGGVELQADIAAGFDIELSCSTIREGTADSIWQGMGGLIIDGGSVRLASNCDMGSKVDSKTGRRHTTPGSISGSFWSRGRKDNYIRTEDDLAIAVGDRTDHNHNELVVESPNICGVFINISEDANIIFSDGTSAEQVEEYKGYDGRVLITEAQTQRMLDIGDKLGVPVYGIYRGKAYRVGGPVQRVESSIFGKKDSHPFRERSFYPEPMPFSEIRHGGGISEQVMEQARKRVPEEVFAK